MRLAYVAGFLLCSSAWAADSKTQTGLAPDPSVDPCVDFYQYACNAWNRSHPAPPDRSRWGRFPELQERNLEVLRGILEKASQDNPGRPAVEQKIGDYYAACMDEREIETKGLAPLKPELNRIAAIANKMELTGELAHLHRLGVSAVFRFGGQPDRLDSKNTIAVVAESGLSLPDRDYYLKTDAASAKLRDEFTAHVEAMFRLLGDPAETAAARAKAVLNIETELAKAMLDRVARRNPSNTYHKLTVHELVSLDPGIDWDRYFKAMGAPAFEALNVGYPPYFRQVESLIVQTGLEDWKTYLSWELLRDAAPLLPGPFVDENFRFEGKVLAGRKDQSARWKRCVQFTDRQLGDLLGQKFVESTFGADGKERTLEMVRALEAALAGDIRTLDWMSPETKEQALLKLRAISNKIGYPDRWQDYNGLIVARGDALGNSYRAATLEVERHIAEIGKPVDRKEWGMSAPTVNASYYPPENTVTFPAGILQPPFYDKARDDAMNFGGIGAVIGHELTHGFDDTGRKFDADGNLRDWWTAADSKEFEKRASCLVDEYSAFSPVDGVKLNGRLTLGENTADNGGVRIALMALVDRMGKKSQEKIDGFTAEQRFFLGFAGVWCESMTEQTARMLANIDPHSPGRFRVNGVLSNLPEFQKAFSCHAGQPMVRGPACRVW